MADDNYQVLARKWRPQKFDQVVGQSAIVRTLSNALDQGKVAHAYCFSGIRGVGKTTIARLVAKGLNCGKADAPTSEPCGECTACVEIEESRNLDVIELDAASQTGVDSIRQLNEVARYTPLRDRYRVFIIDETHMLSANAFNALLKTLEEPPPHVVFILATTEPHKILPTVLSRCQHYPLRRISQAEITGQLQRITSVENVSVSADGLAIVAIAADGSLRDAQSLLDKLIAFGGDQVDDETVVSLLGMVDRELLFGTTKLVAEQDLAGVLKFVNKMVEQGTDLHQFTLDFLGHLRALLVVATIEDAGEILHLPEDELERLRQQAAMFKIDDLDRAFALLSVSEYKIKQSEVPRYQLEMILSRLARMPRLEPIEDLVSQLRSGSGGETSGGSGPKETGGQERNAGDARAATTQKVGGPARNAGSKTPADPGLAVAPKAARPAPHEAPPSGEVKSDNGADYIVKSPPESGDVVSADKADNEPVAENLKPKGPPQERNEQLWERAQGEPMVKNFVDRLRGNLTDVEDV